MDYESRPAQTVTRSGDRPSFDATNQAAWSSFSVQTSRTTTMPPSCSMDQPDRFASASNAARRSPSSQPSGNVTSNGSVPAGCFALATPLAT